MLFIFNNRIQVSCLFVKYKYPQTMIMIILSIQFTDTCVIIKRKKWQDESAINNVDLIEIIDLSKVLNRTLQFL